MRACVASGATLARENAPVAESLTTTRLATTWLSASRGPRGGIRASVGGGEPGLPGHLVDPRLVGPQGSEAGLARVLQAEGGDPDQLGAAGDRVRAGIPAVDVDDDMGRASAIVDRDGAVGADGHDHAVGPGL